MVSSVLHTADLYPVKLFMHLFKYAWNTLFLSGSSMYFLNDIFILWAGCAEVQWGSSQNGENRDDVHHQFSAGFQD